jgi:hypothetical protein
MPYGPGTAFESPYVYAGSNPAVNVDPGGMRFSNAVSFGGNKGPKAPNPTCDACDLGFSSVPSFDSDLGTWGSRKATNADRKLYAKWRAKALGAAFSDGYAGDYYNKPFAGFMMNMYLKNVGGDVTWTAGTVNRVQARAWNSLLSGLEEMQYSHQPLANIILESESAGSSKFESGWESVRADKVQQPDVFYGMASFYIKTVANRSPSGKWCRRLYVADRFNFDPKHSPWDREAFELFEAGLAKPFNFYAGIDIGR